MCYLGDLQTSVHASLDFWTLGDLVRINRAWLYRDLKANVSLVQLVRHWTLKLVIISCIRSSPTGDNFFALVTVNPLNTIMPFLPTLYKLWKTRVSDMYEKFSCVRQCQENRFNTTIVIQFASKLSESEQHLIVFYTQLVSFGNLSNTEIVQIKRKQTCRKTIILHYAE